MPDREGNNRTKKAACLSCLARRGGGAGAPAAHAGLAVRSVRTLFGAASRVVLALVLSAALALGLCPSWAGIVPQAQAAESIDGWYVKIEDGCAYILSALNHDKENPIVVPSEVGGYPVKGLRDNAQPGFIWSREDPVSVVVSEGIESIGAGVFHTEECIVSIVLPSTVKSIGDYTLGSTSITSMSFPEGVETWGTYILSGNEQLSDVHLPSDMTAIPEGMFVHCESLTSLSIPSGVTAFGESAFRGTGFESFTVPSSVTSMGARVLSYCPNLQSAVVPGSVKALPATAFYQDENLTKVVLGEGMTSIGAQAFDECRKLKSVYIPASMTFIDEDAFLGFSSMTVHYGGTESQWRQLVANSDPNAFQFDSYTVEYNADMPEIDDPEPTPDLPIPMTSLEPAVYENGAVTVNWDLHLSVEGKAEITGYEVMRRQGLATEFQVIARVDASTSFYVDTDVEQYQTYNYTVRAVSGSRVGPYNERGVDVSTTPLVDTIMLCGEERPAGEYPITFRSDAQDYDITRDFYYTEDFFRTDGRTYNHELAKMSLGLVASGFSTHESDAYWYAGTSDGVGREDNVLAAYETLGFDNPKVYAYAASLNSTEDKVACSFARKTFSRSGAVTTVVPVVLRGGGYGSEWSSNFVVSAGTDPGSTHYGFRRAAEKVYDQLKAYLAEESEKGELGTVKLWIVGYSRAAATANLLTAKVCNHLGDDMSAVMFDSNVFAYTFATPAALTADEEGDWSWDYHQNISADTLLPTFQSKESCIHNIIYSGDIVPRIPLDDWGFYRNGIDYYLPVTRQNADIQQLNAIYQGITGASFDFAGLATTSDVSADENAFATVCGSVDWYRLQYQEALSDILQYANTKLLVETGTDVSKMEKIAGLDHIDLDGADGLAVISATWAVAKAATPIVADALGADVNPDELVPYVTIGMLHGLTPDVIGVFLQLRVGMLPGISTDGVAMGHHPEVYMTLMEYFGEEDLEPRATSRSEAASYADVAAGEWYADTVAYVSSRGIMTGYAGTSDFGPDDQMVRQDVACMLFKWLAPEEAAAAAEAGHAAFKNETGLSDVEDGAYYTAAANWCYQNGVFKGYSDSNKLGVGDRITREQFATVICRALGGSGSGGISGSFPDKGSVSPWAQDAMSWAVSSGIISGADGMLLPQGNATRAQVAAMIMRAEQRG